MSSPSVGEWIQKEEIERKGGDSHIFCLIGADSFRNSLTTFIPLTLLVNPAALQRGLLFHLLHPFDLGLYKLLQAISLH
jgi:hypothetical protein